MGQCCCHGPVACAEDVSVFWSVLSSGSCAHASPPWHRHSAASPTTHRTWGSRAVHCRSLAGDTGHKPGDPISSGSRHVSAAHCPLHLPGRPDSHSQRGGWGRGRGRGRGTGDGRGLAGAELALGRAEGGAGPVPSSLRAGYCPPPASDTDVSSPSCNCFPGEFLGLWQFVKDSHWFQTFLGRQ